MPWLQKICFWVLGKLSAYQRFDKAEYDYVEFVYDDIVRAIIDHKDMLELVFHQRPEYLVMGRDEFFKLANTETFSSPYAIMFPPDYQTARVNQPKMFAGLKILVVPWMEGMIVLPKIEDQRFY